ncbi:MAG: hypothetical protein ACRD5D_06070 [Candidatus Polarisedimenticolia bacterium]
MLLLLPALGCATGLEEKASRARNELESARVAAEQVLAGGPPDDGAEAARERARRALLIGSEALGAAARDGGDSAEGWARLIQERMMRLEESIEALPVRRPEHAGS